MHLIAFQGQRLSSTAPVIELWFHVLVVQIDHQPSPSSALLNLRVVLAEYVDQAKRGADIDLDPVQAHPAQFRELLALSQMVIHALPSERLTPIPASFLSSIAPHGGVWSSDYATFEVEAHRLQLFGQSFLQLLHGRLALQQHTHQAWQSCREDVLYRTHQLRSSTEPVWFRLRYLLQNEGFDLQQIWVAELHDEDAAMLCGILVTRERRVYMLDFAYTGVPVLEGWLSAWWDITDEWNRLAYRTAITIALTCIAEEV